MTGPLDVLTVSVWPATIQQASPYAKVGTPASKGDILSQDLS